MGVDPSFFNLFVNGKKSSEPIMRKLAEFQPLKLSYEEIVAWKMEDKGVTAGVVLELATNLDIKERQLVTCALALKNGGIVMTDEIKEHVYQPVSQNAYAASIIIRACQEAVSKNKDWDPEQLLERLEHYRQQLWALSRIAQMKED